jgi:uncharacterized coiled-coil DUF342 family protein
MDDPNYTMSMDISDQERDTLQQMIGELQQTQDTGPMQSITMAQEIEILKNRMSYLTNMCVTIERSIKPLHEVIRLNLEKCEILNQRINTIIESLRLGEPL